MKTLAFHRRYAAMDPQERDSANGHRSKSCCLVLLGLVGAASCWGQDASPAKTLGRDPVSRLQLQLDQGTAALVYDDSRGYLPSLLRQLKVSSDSQMLVFSKTSFQRRHISPRSPRAIYFNDNTYVGWVPRGETIEISTVDPEKGAVFYTLRQEESESPTIVRNTGNCLTCHHTTRTRGVPGHLVRSVYSSVSVQPHVAGTFRTNHSSPLAERWGGWYVTGTHGAQRHMGNVVAADRRRPQHLDVEAGANVTDLSELTRIESYLTPHSDIVALMVLEHQTDMHNLLAVTHDRARRVALAKRRRADSATGKTTDRTADRADDRDVEAGERLLAAAISDLVDYLLFVEEAPLTDRVQGVSTFQESFVARGPKDQMGRSLRDFNLKQRLFEHPCSYLIYSEAFLALPNAVKQSVFRELWDALDHKNSNPKFAHLQPTQKSAIREILINTHPELPAYWKAK